MPTDVILLDRVWPPATAPMNHVSQIGGRPNLPANMIWPEIVMKHGVRVALDFLAQINLKELPQVSQRDLLPATGTLYFFALSQSHVRLDDLGPAAAQVLYSPEDARGVPRRRPPPSAGWNQDELHHGRTVAAEFRDTDEPRSALHPRCPVVARSAKVGNEENTGAPVEATTSFDFRGIELPRRVEDGVLHINFARNYWRESILPFKDVREHFTHAAQIYVEFEGKPFPNGRMAPPRPRPVYVDNCLSDDFWASFTTEYLRWRDRAASLKAQLLTLSRGAVLRDDHREAVRAVVAASDALARKVHNYGLFFSNRAPTATRIALATLLLEHPEIAREHRDEVMAAHPSRQKLNRTITHRMLGPSFNVQGGTMDGPDPVLLLQLESDVWGPRLSWWDGGNLTFWISAQDVAARRFERARAEIEGY
jgi:hypothetical protein